MAYHRSSSRYRQVSLTAIHVLIEIGEQGLLILTQGTPHVVSRHQPEVTPRYKFYENLCECDGDGRRPMLSSLEVSALST